MSKANRRLKAQRRAAEYAKRNHGPKRICRNCGEVTTSGHFIPPSFGDPGMFICTIDVIESLA